MIEQPSETFTFGTEAERDAFVRGILWERDGYPADIICNPPINGKYEIELFKIQDEEEVPQ